MATRSKPPLCPYCGKATTLLSGEVLHGGRRHDLAGKWFWRCHGCDAHVGCRGKTRRALGDPANAELRRARGILHAERLDPIWKGAITSGGYLPEDRTAIAVIRNTARKRVYEWLAWKLGIDPEDAKADQFSLADCRRAWVALAGVDYPTIRAWAKARPKPTAEEHAHG